MEAFRAQLAVCRIKQREFTGVGFYTQLVVPQRLVVASIDRVVLTNAMAELEGLEHGAGFNLFIQGGMFDVLEGFTFETRGLTARISSESSRAMNGPRGI